MSTKELLLSAMRRLRTSMTSSSCWGEGKEEEKGREGEGEGEGGEGEEKEGRKHVVWETALNIWLVSGEIISICSSCSSSTPSWHGLAACSSQASYVVRHVLPWNARYNEITSHAMNRLAAETVIAIPKALFSIHLLTNLSLNSEGQKLNFS